MREDQKNTFMQGKVGQEINSNNWEQIEKPKRGRKEIKKGNLWIGLTKTGESRNHKGAGQGVGTGGMKRKM